MANLPLESRARLYCERRNIAIEKPLGHGNDGAVWQTNRPSAIKACEDDKRYGTERDCYRIFASKRITEIRGYAVPRLIDCSDELLVIEMDVVEPPYIIDFGKAYLRRMPPKYSQQTMADWLAEKKELYGDHWPEIQKILNVLRGYGIYHMDPKPANILPANWNPSLDD